MYLKCQEDRRRACLSMSISLVDSQTQNPPPTPEGCRVPAHSRANPFLKIRALNQNLKSAQAPEDIFTEHPECRSVKHREVYLSLNNLKAGVLSDVPWPQRRRKTVSADCLMLGRPTVQTPREVFAPLENLRYLSRLAIRVIPCCLFKKGGILAKYNNFYF